MEYIDRTDFLLKEYPNDFYLEDDEEIFTDLKDLEHYYISNYGRIFKERLDNNNKSKPRFINTHSNNNGTRVCFNIFNNGTGINKVLLVASAMLKSFVGNPNSFRYVSYRDGNPLNTKLNNLYWSSKQFKLDPSKETKPKKERYLKGYNFPIWVKDFSTWEYWDTLENVAKSYNISMEEIANVINKGNGIGTIDKLSRFDHIHPVTFSLNKPDSVKYSMFIFNYKTKN